MENNDLASRLDKLEEKVKQIANATSKKPADHIIYKGKAALQFSLKAGQPKPIPGRDSLGRPREYVGTDKGVLFVVAAPADGEKSYNWKKKVTIGLNEHEISKLILAMKGHKQSFFHDRHMGNSDKQGKEVKRMDISPSPDEKALFVKIRENNNGNENVIPVVPISKEEAIGLIALLEGAIPKILGWD